MQFRYRNHFVTVTASESQHSQTMSKKKRESCDRSFERKIRARRSDSFDYAVVEMTFDDVAEIVSRGESQKLQQLIDQGRISDINGIHDTINIRNAVTSFKNLVMVACEAGAFDCVKILSKHGANINSQNEVGDSTLLCACRSGNTDLLRFLINEGVEINDNVLLDCLQRSAVASNVEAALLLITLIENINTTNAHGSFLYYAILGGEVEVVRAVLDRGATFIDPDDLQRDPLYLPSSRGLFDVVNHLLTWGSTHGPIPAANLRHSLFAASVGRCINTVTCLVEFGTDEATLNEALLRCVRVRGSAEIAEYLLNIISICTLTYACLHGSESAMIRALLLRVTNINQADVNHRTPLQSALPYYNATEILLDSGAEPDRHFADGSTALLEVVDNDGSLDVLTLLLTHPLNKANPCVSHSHTYETPLMVAARKLRIDFMTLLLLHRSDVTQVNVAGLTVLDILGPLTETNREALELCTRYEEVNIPPLEHK